MVKERTQLDKIADDIGDDAVAHVPEVSRLESELAAANAEHAAAVKRAQEQQERIAAVAVKAVKAKDELEEIESGLPGLAVNALLGDADAHARFAQQEKRAEDLRALLRQHELAKPGLQLHAQSALRPVQNVADGVARLQEILAEAKKKARRELARKKM